MISSVTSLLHIRWPACAAGPAVSYRLTLTGAAGGAGPRAGAESATVTFAGTHVPAHRLPAQFAEQRQALAGPLASLADLTVMGPAVSTTGKDTAPGYGSLTSEVAAPRRRPPSRG